jgi:photosystem II stability/assembly factor-like uncharacterized protein
MANQFNPAQVHNQSDVRVYYQPGGAGPANPVYLAGGGQTSYIDLTGLTIPVSGDVNFQKVHDPYNRKKYVNSAEIVEAPDNITGSVGFYVGKGGVPRAVIAKGCRLNIYAAAGDCKDGTDPLMITASTTFADSFYSGALNFGLVGAAQATEEILDATYGCKVDCGDCGPADNGTSKIYALKKPATGAKAAVLYSLDGGATWTSSSIATAAIDEVPTTIALMGNYLIVVSPTANTATSGGYYYSDLSTLGVPNATWTKVTTGFVNNSEPRDITVLGAREAYICGDAGYIYALSEPSAGVTVNNAAGTIATDLTRIHSIGDVIAATGLSGGMILSTNRGRTWATVTTPAALAAVEVSAVFVQSARQIWIGGGTAVGRFYYTLDGGSTWTEKTIPQSGTGAVGDIKFVTPEVGYVLHTVSSVGRLYATLDGGYSWTNIANRVLNFPALVRANRVAIPYCSDTDVAVNNLMVAALGATSSGRMALGVAGIV